MYGYVLFDLDGTLTDPKEGITKCVQHALRKFGIETDTEDLLPFIGPPLRDSFQEFYGLTREESEQAVVYYRERFRTVGLFENVPYEGMKEMLAALDAAGIKLGVATSKPEVFARQILDKFEMSPYFTAIVGSNLDGTRENKHEVVEEVIRQLNAPSRDQILMVGDRKFDVLGARESGLPCAAVTYGYAQGNELAEAEPLYMVDTVAELQELLLSESVPSESMVTP